MPEPKIGIIEYATVVGDAHNNLIAVRFDGDEASTEVQNALIFNGQPTPRAGTQGLVIVVGANEAQKTFWLGSIGDVVSDYRKPQPSINPEDITFFNEKKNASLKISENIIALTNPSSSLLFNKQGMSLSQGSQSLNFSEREFEIRTKKSKFKLSDQAFGVDTSGSINLLSGGDMNLFCKNDLLITGGLYDSKNSDFYSRYGSINRFYLRTVEGMIDVGNTFMVDAGAIVVKATSGSLVGGFPPGTGSSTTISVEVIEGDLVTSTSQGDIELNCLSDLNEISIYAGQKPASALFSEINITSRTLEIKNSTGLNTSIKLSSGKISLKTDENVEVNTLQKFLVDSTMDIEIKTKTQMTLEATTKIALKGDSQITTETPILDFSNAQMIKTGPKEVTPSGTGPFCAIKTCPILGVPHTGEICNG